MITVTVSTMTRGVGAAAGKALATVLLATTALGGLALVATPALAQSARSYDIAAGALVDVLNQYARQAGVELAYRAELTASLSSPGLKGSYGPADGLSRVLVGTGLTFRQTGPRAFTLERAPQSSSSAIQLGPVRVEGEGERGGGNVAASVTSDPEATERTGAYTPSATRSATRMPLSLRETPQSVTVITSQQIEDRAITGLAEAMETTPGVRVVTSLSLPGFYSRGLPISNLQVEGNAMFSSGQALSNIQSDNMIAYDRIEVVRGANGLLTGPGDPSGAVTLVRKRPTREFQAHVQGSAGSWNNWAGEADVSTPLNASGTVRGRVAAGIYDGDYFIEATGRDGKALLATVEADLTPSTVVRLGYQHDQYTIEGMGAGAVPLWYSNGQPFDAPRSLNKIGPRETVVHQTARDLFAGLEHKFGNGWTFQGTIDLARRGRDRDPGVFSLSMPNYPDPSGRGATMSNAPPFPITDSQWAYNFDVQGPVNLFGREHRLMFGASGWDRKRETHGRLEDMSGQPPASFAANFPTRDISTWSLAYPSWRTGFPRSKQYTEQHGGFAAVRWDLADSLKLITGLRVTNWKTYTDNYNQLTGALTQARSGAYSVRGEITPYVGAVWDFHPNISAYASYADILKPQNLYDADDNLLNPIVGKNYEAGLKGEFLNKQLNASLALFRVVQDNLGQLDPNYPTGYVTPGGNTPYISAGKGVTTKGFEAEVSGALRPGWNIRAGYTYAQSKNAAGQTFDPNLPEHLLRVFSTYQFQGRLSDLTLGAGGSWNSSISRVMQRPTGAYRPNGQPVTANYDFRQNSVLLVTAMARYQVTPQLSLLLNVENLLDHKYYNSATGGGADANYGTPRRWRATLRYQF